jgi:hypothetical protein
MCIAIPPRHPVGSVIGFLKGKSAIAVARLNGKETNKLDHFPSPPEKDLRNLDKELKDNYHAHGVLRDLVLTFLYLRQVVHQVRSKLMSRFGIEAVANSKLLNNADKHRMRHSLRESDLPRANCKPDRRPIWFQSGE